MARTFQRNDVAVLYRYMGDSIPVCKFSQFPQSYLHETRGGEVTRLSRQDLALKLRTDKKFLEAVRKGAHVSADTPITSVSAGISDDGTGYVYVDFPAGTDMSALTRPYAEEAGKRKRLQNIAISYWSKEAATATGAEVMPPALAEAILASIDSLVEGYCKGAAALARWEALVSNARAGLQALKAAGIAESDTAYQTLLKQANTPKPRSK